MNLNNPVEFELDVAQALVDFPEVIPDCWEDWLYESMQSYLDGAPDDDEAALDKLINEFNVVSDTEVFGEDMDWLKEFLLMWMDAQIEFEGPKFYELFMAMKAENRARYVAPISLMLSDFHTCAKSSPGGQWIPYCELIGRLTGDTYDNNSEQGRVAVGDRVAIEDLTAVLGILRDAFNDDRNLNTEKQQQQEQQQQHANSSNSSNKISVSNSIRNVATSSSSTNSINISHSISNRTNRTNNNNSNSSSSSSGISGIKSNSIDDDDKRTLQRGAIQCLVEMGRAAASAIASREWTVAGYGNGGPQTVKAEHWGRWTGALQAIARDLSWEDGLRRDAFRAAEMLDVAR